MKRFLAVYTGSKTGAQHKKWEALDADARKKREQEGMAAWMAWAEKNSKSIVDMGAPVGKTKQINATGISNITNSIAAFTVVQAESYDDAAKIFVNHPHFMIFPGDSVEVMECLPIPSR